MVFPIPCFLRLLDYLQANLCYLKTFYQRNRLLNKILLLLNNKILIDDLASFLFEYLPFRISFNCLLCVVLIYFLFFLLEEDLVFWVVLIKPTLTKPLFFKIFKTNVFSVNDVVRDVIVLVLVFVKMIKSLFFWNVEFFKWASGKSLWSVSVRNWFKDWGWFTNSTQIDYWIIML